jgi:hypothetical protein
MFLVRLITISGDIDVLLRLITISGDIDVLLRLIIISGDIDSPSIVAHSDLKFSQKCI